MSICQHCKQQPAVLNDWRGVLCARRWMQINTPCRPDGAIARNAMGIFDDGPEKQALIDAIDFCINRAY